MAKRGRPKTKQPGPDLGTPELQRYRQLHLFSDPLDLALERQLIEEYHHYAGLTYRWLYTLQYGSPHVAAYDLLRTKGKSQSKYNNEFWLLEKEQMYLLVRNALKARNLHQLILDVCVFSIPQKFLLSPGEECDILMKLQEGLEIIHTVFEKTRKKKNIGIMPLHSQQNSCEAY